MTYRIEFSINELPVSGNQLLRMHWAPRDKYNKRWYELVRLSTLRSKPPKPLKAARILFIRYGTRHLDFDNLTTSFKPILDGCVKAGLLVDDSTKILKEVKYSFMQVAKNSTKITVLIESE